MNCGDLSDPNNGTVNISTPAENGVATYSCNEGFLLLGTMARVCQSNSTWSDETPICTGKDTPI